MIYPPHNQILKKHIDHYWIVKSNLSELFEIDSKIYAYPGITPDLLIVLDGYFSYKYLGKKYSNNTSILFSFINDKLLVDFSSLKSFVLIKFKSRALSSLLPFVPYNSERIMAHSVVPTEIAFNTSINSFIEHLKGLDNQQIIEELDGWFISNYKKEREGIVVDLAEEIAPSFDLKIIMDATKYSYTTLERHFKRDTGITPKKYQSLLRYKLAVREIYQTKNKDWHYYVAKYGYFDQSHFIKEIKKFTSFTPNQLLNISSFIDFRPL